MRVLITGASGQLGRALANHAPAGLQLQALDHSALDISNATAVEAAVTACRPDLVINTAAYTAVDIAESEPDKAAAVNISGATHLAESALNQGNCRLLHVSTDYVFDGDSEVPYDVQATPNPLGVYGRTKYLGELAILKLLGDKATVVRTAWLYSASGKNFLTTMLQLMHQQRSIRVVDDQRGSPTTAESVAKVLWRLAKLPRAHGILHWTDEGITTWYGFAVAIAEEVTAAGLLDAYPAIIPISTAQYPTASRRPAYSVLDTRHSAQVLGLDPVPWRDNLRQTVLRLARANE